MRVLELDLDLERLPAPLPIHRATLGLDQWTETAAAVAAGGGRLVSLWGSDRRRLDGNFAICAAYATAEGLLWADLPLSPGAPDYASISHLFPAAGRMQRATHDLLGLIAIGDPDKRPWLRHGAWPADYFPLRQEHSGLEVHPATLDDYPFVPVAGDGVHEIAVGPVHAGIIEPGHFRFSVVGEKVLRLEERLGYVHKGIEKRFAGLAPEQGLALASRVSGDSTVAYGWAYCMAIEALVACRLPDRAKWLRALMLERERVANHLGDLGALGNDAAFALGLANFSRLKEHWLRLNKEVFGHRFMMECIRPGGVAGDVDAAACDRLRRQCDEIEREVHALKSIYDEHAGLQDRFITTGRVEPPLAARLGLTGFAGRASGLAFDLRNDFNWCPYDQFDFKMSSHRGGDVAARVTVRFEEVFESLRLIREIAAQLPAGETQQAFNGQGPAGHGAGWVEGWRGEILIALDMDASGHILRCHCHDPSWHNWPVLEHAIIGNIVPDFPLINKSFNLSYAGHDL